MNTLLVIGYVWPEPKSSAAGAHMLSLMQFFKEQSWRVIFATPAQKTEYIFDLAEAEIETLEIKLNDSSFDQQVISINPTAVLFDRFMMEEQFGWRVAESCPKALRILDTEDLQCLRTARQEAHKQRREFSLNDLHSELAKREIAAIFRCDLSLIISDFELQLLTKHFKIDPSILIHVPFMLSQTDSNQTAKISNQSSLGKKSLSFSERQHFVTIGNLRHAPNWDSVLYLQQLWPAIKKQLPKAELHIYGAYTPPKATALNNKKLGFLIKDRAEDVHQIMSEARVCLSPLRFGAGIKGKLIDAMLEDTPSITTDIGAEGMTNGHPWPGIVANSEPSIIEAAISLYSDQNLWRSKQALCQPLLNGVYNKEKIAARLEKKLGEVFDDLECHRKSNFIGSMLAHHSLRSSKFMSKWIEEKNKQ